MRITKHMEKIGLLTEVRKKLTNWRFKFVNWQMISLAKHWKTTTKIKSTETGAKLQVPEELGNRSTNPFRKKSRMEKKSHMENRKEPSTGRCR